ncbi:Vacuolar inheritance and morphology protein [Mucor circinelloides]
MPVNNGEGSEEEPQQQQQEKRPILPKYATTTHADKKIASVSTAAFNKNLTIEKARFDSASSANIPHPPTASNSTPTTLLAPPIVKTPPPIDDQHDTPHPTIPQLTTSVTLPAVATIQSLSGASTPTTASTINTMPSQSTPLMTKSTKPTITTTTTKATDDRRSTIKRKKLPPMSGTATPSEVFHRNLVDAVSNVEDSDENEQYVYPYSGNNTDSTYHMNSTDTIHRTTSSSLYRPQSTRSFINNSSQQDLLPTKSSSGFLGDLLRPILFKSKSDSKAIYKQQREENFARPKLRSYVMDHPYNQATQTAKDWFDGKHSPPLYQGGSRRKLYTNYGLGGNDGGYTTDDEEAQHLLATHSTRRSQHQQQQQHHRKQTNACSRLIRNILIFLISLVIVLFLCITYLAKPLQELNVEISRVLSSDKELIFDLHISAINSNIWTIHVAEADISVFAFSQVVPMNSLIPSPIPRGVDPAEYLGGFYHFDEPLSFPSSLISKNPVTAISQIRIKSPGADKSGNERWSRIIRYPYGLVVRGVLKNRPLAFLSPYPQSIAICDVVRVNPTTDKVSEDPDQGFCLSYGNNHTVVTTVAASHVNQTAMVN